MKIREWQSPCKAMDVACEYVWLSCCEESFAGPHVPRVESFVAPSPEDLWIQNGVRASWAGRGPSAGLDVRSQQIGGLSHPFGTIEVSASKTYIFSDLLDSIHTDCVGGGRVCQPHNAVKFTWCLELEWCPVPFTLSDDAWDCFVRCHYNLRKLQVEKLRTSSMACHQRICELREWDDGYFKITK